MIYIYMCVNIMCIYILAYHIYMNICDGVLLSCNLVIWGRGCIKPCQITKCPWHVHLGTLLEDDACGARVLHV